MLRPWAVNAKLLTCFWSCDQTHPFTATGACPAKHCHCTYWHWQVLCIFDKMWWIHMAALQHSCTDSVLWQHMYNLCLLPFTSFFIFVSRFNFNPLQAGKIWAASFTVTYSWHLSMKAIYGNNKTENQDNIKASMPPQITKSLCWGAYLSLAVTERWLSAELSSFCKQPYGFMTRLSVTIKSITSIDQISPFINRCCVISSYFGCFRRQKASVTTTWK